MVERELRDAPRCAVLSWRGGRRWIGRSAFTWEAEQDLIEVIVKQPETEVASYVLRQEFPPQTQLFENFVG